MGTHEQVKTHEAACPRKPSDREGQTRHYHSKSPAESRAPQKFEVYLGNALGTSGRHHLGDAPLSARSSRPRSVESANDNVFVSRGIKSSPRGAQTIREKGRSRDGEQTSSYEKRASSHERRKGHRTYS